MIKFPKKFQTRLLLLVLLPLIPALLLVLFTNLELRREGVRQTRQDSLQSVQLATANLDGTIEGVRQLLDAIAGLPAFKGPNRKLYDSHFANLLKLHPEYINYGLIDPDGKVFSSAVQFPEGTSFLDLPCFKDVLRTQSFVVGTYQIDRAVQKPGLYFAYPLMDKNDRLLRVVFAVLDATYVNQTVGNMHLSSNATLKVMDAKGVVLASIPEVAGAVGKTAREASLIKGLNDLVTTEVKGEDDTLRLYALAPVGKRNHAGLYVSVWVPKKSAYAVANQVLFRNLIMLGMVLFLALLMTRHYANQSILGPVDALMLASRRIAQGDLAARTGTTADESQLGQMARIFDEMAETIQKRQTEITEAEARFRSLVEQSIVGIYVIQGDRFTYVNPKLERILGYSFDELVGRPLLEFIAPDDRKRVHENVQLRLQGIVHSVQYTLSLVRKDGTQVKADVHGAAAEYNGKAAIIGTLLDVTDRDRAEAEVRRLNAELEQRVIERTAQLAAANKELEAFSYSVSHDLRAPVRHINGYVGMLKEDAEDVLTAEHIKYLDVISKSAKHMGQLIEDLLNFSRMSRTDMTRQRINMGEVVAEAWRTVQPETKGRNISWKTGKFPEVTADAALLKMVWVNLLSNAVKYTRPRDPAEITAGSETQGDEFVFYVRDNGVGFNPQYSDKLFGVFQRLHKADQFEGTGIGLANVQRIIQRHGGRVWAESKLDEGAVFYFSLPNVAKNVKEEAELPT